MYISMHVYACVCMYVRECVYVCMHACVYACVHACVFASAQNNTCVKYAAVLYLLTIERAALATRHSHNNIRTCTFQPQEAS